MNLFIKTYLTKYKPENIIRLFYPDIKLLNARHAGEEFIFFRQTKRKLFVALRMDGVTLSDSSTSEDTERFLYDFLRSTTKKPQPWGMLCGVRPLWLYRQRMLNEREHNDIKNELITQFDVSEEKVELLRRCYDTQLSMPIERQEKNAYSLYISIPYCPSRCRYCSFISMSANDREEIELYLKLLLKEMEEIASSVEKPPLSVYIGGGTPTILSAFQLERLLSEVNRLFSPSQEFTVEAGRPDSIDGDKLKVMKVYGVDRISINPQTFNNDTLKAIGRLHTAQDIINCFELARSLGHENINMDLIAGLPTDTFEGFKYSLAETITLGPQSITVHSFTRKSGSHLSRELLSNDNDMQRMMTVRDELLYGEGYSPYYIYRQKKTPSNLENVGYAKKGFECLYNVYMMDELHDVISAGAGGVTKFVEPNRTGIKRIFHPKYPKEYIASRQKEV